MPFSSKILLLGEYSIVLGGCAVAIPFNKYSGHLSQKTTPLSNESNIALSYFSNWLNINKDDFPFLDVEKLANDVKQGIWFNSNIPHGYGLGSSGALVAAVYSEYTKQLDTELGKLKNRLAAIESFFHGSSSGIDPLVAYTNETVWVTNSSDVILLPNWDINKLGFNIYLVDTKAESKTIQLVEWFKARMLQSAEFNERTRIDFLPSVELLANQIGNGEPLNSEALLKVSRYELEYLSPMVPDNFRKHFFAGIDSGYFLFKLCGSGGGGFMLCFANNSIKSEDYFNKNGLKFHNVTQALTNRQ